MTVFVAALGGLMIFFIALYLGHRGNFLLPARLKTFFAGATPKEKDAKKRRFVWLGHLSRLPSPLVLKHLPRGLERNLAQADIPMKAREFLALQVALTLVPAGLLLFAFHRVIPAFEWMLLGIFLPPLLVKGLRLRRKANFERQLGEVLSTMASGLRAGFGLQQVLDMISKDNSPPLGMEFSRTLREVALGQTLEKALTNMVGRVESADLELLVTAISIQRQVGGNLAEVLDRASHTIRERARIKGEVRSLTAQGRLSGIIIGSLPFALAAFIMAINPSYMGTMFRHPLGLAALGIALFGEILGCIVIMRIINIKP